MRLVAVCSAILGALLLATAAPAADQPGDVVKGGHKEIHATVDKIDAGVIHLKVPGQMPSRTLSQIQAERMGLKDIKVGEELSLVMDENNVIIDAHRAGTPGHGHRSLMGILEEAGPAGKRITLKTSDGTKSSDVDSAASSKVAGLKKGDRLHLELDEANTVIDIHPQK